MSERCPSELDLLLVTTNEVAAPDAEALHAHLVHCEHCRRVLAEMEETVQLFAIHDAEDDPTLSGQALFDRFAPRLHAARQAAIHRPAHVLPRWWPAIAAAVMLLVVGIAITRTAAVLRADGLLARVAWREADARTKPIDRVELRVAASTASAVHATPVDVTAYDPRQAMLHATRAWPAAWRDHLLNAPVDWTRPLSIAPVRAWRASLKHKSDRVTREGVDVVVRISTPDGALQAVVVALRSDTYEVKKQTLVFDRLGQVEIVPLPSRRRDHASATVPATSARSVVSRDELERAELAARLLVRHAELDVTGDLHIAATREEVVVEGIVRSAPRRRAAVGQLAAIPHLRVALFSPIDPTVQGAGRRRSAHSGWFDPAEEGAMTEGGGPVSELLRRVARVRQRTAALQELAIRYPTNSEERLTSTTRRLLRQLVDAHHQALGRDLGMLTTELHAVVGSPQTDTPFMATPPRDWSGRAARIAHLGNVLEVSIQKLVGLTPQTNERAAVEHVASTLALLRDAFAH